jgi:hypothetical protein
LLAGYQPDKETCVLYSYIFQIVDPRIYLSIFFPQIYFKNLLEPKKLRILYESICIEPYVHEKDGI